MLYDWDKFTILDKVCFIPLVIVIVPFGVLLWVIGMFGEFCIELLQDMNNFILEVVNFPRKDINR